MPEYSRISSFLDESQLIYFNNSIENWIRQEQENNCCSQTNLFEARDRIEQCFYNPLTETFLNLSRLKLTSIPSVISIMHNLIEIDLRFNALSDFPKAILSLEKLKYLQLSYNEICFIPQEISNLSELRLFGICKNYITHLPDNFYKLRNLKVVDLSNNKIRVISPKISQLCDLEALNLEGNLLSTLPEQFSRLPNLKVLVLNHNNLSNSLPFICKLKLNHLEITNNKIRQLPDEIGNLDSLIILDLSNNKLKSLPDSIISLVELEKLNLSHNRFSSSDNLKQIPHLPLIRKVDLSFNKLETPPTQLTKSFITVKTHRNLFNTIRSIIDDHPQSQTDEIFSLRLSR